MLSKQAPIPGTGWGCIQCGLAANGAVAVFCDKCLEEKAAVLWVCAGSVGEHARVPFSDLNREWHHITRFHPELIALN